MSFVRTARVGIGRLGRGRTLGVALLALVVVAAVLVTGALLLKRQEHLTALEPVPPGSTAPVRPFSHVYLIVFENKGEGQIIGSPDAPYFRELTSRYGLATEYQGVAHPSQPNYFALFSGSAHDIFDDDPHDLPGPNLADELEAAGRTWRINAEDLPSEPCFTGQRSSDGPDGPGVYVRNHNPAISFTSISGSPSRCANIGDLAAFDPGAADFTMIIPNQCHVMHDCPVSTGDTWLRSFLPRILESPSWQQGGVVFITFDEGADRSEHNQVPTLVIASDVPAGMQSSTAHDHYSLLRTIQDGLGVPCLASSCDANTMGEFFRG
jgi:phosphatidylinositol-3-phosphatase